MYSPLLCIFHTSSSFNYTVSFSEKNRLTSPLRFEYFTLAPVYKVKALFIFLFLIRRTKSLVFIKRYTNQFQLLPKYRVTTKSNKRSLFQLHVIFQ